MPHSRTPRSFVCFLSLFAVVDIINPFSVLDFVLSLAPNGTLKSLVNKYGSLSLGCARYYVALIVDAVLWMHTQGVLHRDLKPENILLDSAMRPKITDFGSAYVSEALDLCKQAHPLV